MEKINAPVTAFAFPGVGVKQSGYELRFFEDHRKEFLEFFEEASEYAGSNFTNDLTNNRIDDLDDSTKQFYTFAYCSAMYSVISDSEIKPDFLAGYSFGIYAALYASGAIGFHEGLAIIERAYQLMEEACCELDCGMALTIGLKEQEVRSLLDAKEYKSLAIVNCNHDVCTICSGTKEEIEDFLSEARKQDALSAETLDVSIPYHNPALLSDVIKEFDNFLRNFTWNTPRYPLVSSIDQQIINDPERLLRFTAENLASPISWKKVVLALRKAGTQRVIECGPGISLTQNGRFIPSEIKYINVKNVKRKLQL